MINKMEAAKWFIKKNPCLASGYFDDNIRLNKRLFFADLLYFVVFSKRLFEDSFIVLHHSPVDFGVYDAYRHHFFQYPIMRIDISDKYLQFMNIANLLYDDMEMDDIRFEDVVDHTKINTEKVKDMLTINYKELFVAFEHVDFQQLKKEIINGNTYYWYQSDITYLSDDMIKELMKEAKSEPQFLEILNGEMILS